VVCSCASTFILCSLFMSLILFTLYTLATTVAHFRLDGVGSSQPIAKSASLSRVPVRLSSAYFFFCGLDIVDIATCMNLHGALVQSLYLTFVLDSIAPTWKRMFLKHGRLIFEFHFDVVTPFYGSSGSLWAKRYLLGLHIWLTRW